jgi:ABC-type uncharacterized transport system ATPase subunit
MAQTAGADRETLLEIANITKEYGGLRPLRLQSLHVHRGSLIALLGFDAPAAELVTNLVTGAMLPDGGEIRLFGRSTADIGDPDEWLRSLDRIGIVTDRSVLLEEFSVAQNLAMALTLEIDPLSPVLAEQAAAVSRDAGVETALHVKVSTLSALARVRVRFGRALALGPALVIMEHPTATLAAHDVTAFAATVRRTVEAREMGCVVLTADRQFAAAVAQEVFRLRPSDGALERSGGGWQRVRRLLGETHCAF